MKGNDRRSKILFTAEKIFARKGSNNTTISEIASRAGVVDSLIYQYFKNKEDLLFSIPYEHLKTILLKLDEHLQGIQNVESRISKMVWFHLSNQDNYPDYARVLLLECRSKAQFYETPAYNLIRKYSAILTGIISAGVNEGAFRNDIDVYIMRDFILGALDWETIACLAAGETEKITTDLEDMLTLIFAAISSKESVPLDKKNRILKVAEIIFSEKGFEGTKMSEIASKADVSEGTIYEYFKNKDNLLLSIPAKHFSRHSSLISNAFKIKDPETKLTRLIREVFSNFLANRNFLKLFLLEIQFHRRFYESKAYGDFKTYFKVIEDIIDEGKASGAFRQDANVRVFRNMLIGTFSHLALRWTIINRNRKVENDIMDEIEQTISLMTSAIKANK